MTGKEPKEITDILRRPFPKEAIKRRVVHKASGTKVDYVEGHTVILRLIEATENQFDVRIVNLNMGDNLVTATVELTIPGLGSRQHIGVQKVNDKQEDLVKGAITDALKKAATLFGVALELYGDDYEAHSDPAANDSQRKRQPARNPAPTQPPTTPAEKTEDDHQTLTDWQHRRAIELQKQLGIENKEFIRALSKHFGKILVNDLTRNEAEALIAKLEAQLPKQAPADGAHDDLPDF